MSRLMADQESRGGDLGVGEEDSVMRVNLAEGCGAVNDRTHRLSKQSAGVIRRLRLRLRLRYSMSNLCSSLTLVSACLTRSGFDWDYCLVRRVVLVGCFSV